MRRWDATLCLENAETKLRSGGTGLIGALFSPGFNVTTNDTFHKLPPGVKPLTVSPSWTEPCLLRDCTKGRFVHTSPLRTQAKLDAACWNCQERLSDGCCIGISAAHAACWVPSLNGTGPHWGCRCHTCFAFCLRRSLRKIRKHQILKPDEENASYYLELPAAEGSVLCEQVYTGYFWFCVMYFFLALVVTQIMMRFPPLGQPRSNWIAWAKVSSSSGSVLLIDATFQAVLRMAGSASDAPRGCKLSGGVF